MASLPSLASALLRPLRSVPTARLVRAVQSRPTHSPRNTFKPLFNHPPTLCLIMPLPTPTPQMQPIRRIGPARNIPLSRLPSQPNRLSIPPLTKCIKACQAHIQMFSTVSSTFINTPHTSNMRQACTHSMYYLNRPPIHPPRSPANNTAMNTSHGLHMRIHLPRTRRYRQSAPPRLPISPSAFRPLLPLAKNRLPMPIAQADHRLAHHARLDPARRMLNESSHVNNAHRLRE
jgi:hypothetical protein